MLEIAASFPTVREAFRDHILRLHAKEHVEQVIGVAAHQRSGQCDQPAARPRQYSKSVTLGSVDPANWCNSSAIAKSNQPFMNLPIYSTGAILWIFVRSACHSGENSFVPPLRALNLFTDLQLIKVQAREPLPISILDRCARIRIDRASEFRTGFCRQEGMAPEIGKLPFVFWDDEH